MADDGIADFGVTLKPPSPLCGSSGAATQRAFAEHLSTWSEPLLTIRSRWAGAFKGLVQAAIPDPDHG